MLTVGVLTGASTREELAPLATEVLPSIAHLPSWIREINATETAA